MTLPRTSDSPQIGRPALSERGFDCCGKPQGCTNTNPRCAFLRHPYKRWVLGEITLAELERINPR